MSLSEQIKECIACEKHFKASDAILAGVSIQFSEQYCSPACEEQFEHYLATEVHRAEIEHLNKEILTEQDVRKIVGNFHLKLQGDKPK